MHVSRQDMARPYRHLPQLPELRLVAFVLNGAQPSVLVRHNGQRPAQLGCQCLLGSVQHAVQDHLQSGEERNQWTRPCKREIQLVMSSSLFGRRTSAAATMGHQGCEVCGRMSTPATPGTAQHMSAIVAFIMTYSPACQPLGSLTHGWRACKKCNKLAPMASLKPQNTSSVQYSPAGGWLGSPEPPPGRKRPLRAPCNMSTKCPGPNPRVTRQATGRPGLCHSCASHPNQVGQHISCSPLAQRPQQLPAGPEPRGRSCRSRSRCSEQAGCRGRHQFSGVYSVIDPSQGDTGQAQP